MLTRSFGRMIILSVFLSVHVPRVYPAQKLWIICCFLCSYLVYVPCNVEQLVRHQYGENTWNKPTKNYRYIWGRVSSEAPPPNLTNYKRCSFLPIYFLFRYWIDAKNYRKNGTWTDEQWKNEANLKFN